MSRKKSKIKRRRRKKRVLKGIDTAVAPNEETDDSNSSGGFLIVAGVFGSFGAAAGAIDGYSEGGLLGALVLMPIAAVFIAIFGVIAVYLRGVIAVLCIPVTAVLVVGVIAYEFIWGLPDTNPATDSVVELVSDDTGT